MYMINISGMKTETAETTLITIGPFQNADIAINQAELVALDYYRINFLELVNKDNITEIVWELDW